MHELITKPCLHDNQMRWLKYEMSRIAN